MKLTCCISRVFAFITLSFPSSESRISSWNLCTIKKESYFRSFLLHKNNACSPTEVCRDGYCVCPEGTESDGNRRCIVNRLPVTEGKILSESWTPCLDENNILNNYCSPAEVCLNGDCLCPEGTENDGGRGCIDVDECATNYPCPGTKGIESFCEDRDPDNYFYKCGCLPGYQPKYSRNYDQSVTGIPFMYRPINCVETFLIRNTQQLFQLSIPFFTNVTALLEEYKNEQRSIIDGISVGYNEGAQRFNPTIPTVVLTANVKTVVGTVASLDCSDILVELYGATCYTMEIKSTYLVVVNEDDRTRTKSLNHKEVLEKYISNRDGFSNIDDSFDRLVENVNQVTVHLAFTTILKSLDRIGYNTRPDAVTINPVHDSPAIHDETLIVVGRSQPKSGGQTCRDDVECLSGACRYLDSKCEDELVSSDLFMTLEDSSLERLKYLTATNAVNVTEALVTVMKDLECKKDANKGCKARLLNSVAFQGYHEPISGIFDSDLFVEKNAKSDECNVTLFTDAERSYTNTLEPFNNETDPLNNETSTEKPTFQLILYFQIIFRCRGCAKGGLFQNDASRNYLRFLSIEQSVPTDLCDEDNPDIALGPLFDKNTFEDNLFAALDPEFASVVEEITELQNVFTFEPSVSPSVSPSSTPSVFPSLAPSDTPTILPSAFPSAFPSVFPSADPSSPPSEMPSIPPSKSPTKTPTTSPTKTWRQLGSDINGDANGDKSIKVSLSADGNRVAVGACKHDGGGTDSGQVRIYDWNGSSWDQVGGDIYGESDYDEAGSNLELSSDGNRVAITATLHDGAYGNNYGHIRIFEFDGSVWTQMGGDIEGKDGGDEFGYSLALSSDGKRVAGGSIWHGSHVGYVLVHEWDGYNWVQIGDLPGAGANYKWGEFVDLSSDGHRLAIGEDYAYNWGRVTIYDWNGVAYTQLGSRITSMQGDLGYGLGLSSDGSRIAVGAPIHDGNGENDSGQVQILDWNGASWVQVGGDIYGEAAGDNSGHVLALSSDGTRVAIGAPNNDGINGQDSGHVRVFDWNGSSWTQVGEDIEGDDANDQISNHKALALSSNGSRVAFGVEDGNGGYVRIYETNG